MMKGDEKMQLVITLVPLISSYIFISISSQIKDRVPLCLSLKTHTHTHTHTPQEYHIIYNTQYITTYNITSVSAMIFG